MIWLHAGRLCKEGLLWVVWGELSGQSPCVLQAGTAHGSGVILGF